MWQLLGDMNYCIIDINLFNEISNLIVSFTIISKLFKADLEYDVCLFISSWCVCIFNEFGEMTTNMYFYLARKSLWNILRPFTKKIKAFEKLRLKRITDSMTYAAKNNLAYHLWWHPHNFGNDPIASMGELRQIISWYLMLRDKYGMENLSMAGIAQQVRVS